MESVGKNKGSIKDKETQVSIVPVKKMYVVVLFLRGRPQDRVFTVDLRPYWNNAKGYF